MKKYQFLAAIAPTAALTLSLLSNPTWAADPFRTANRHPIGDRTEAAFKAVFQDGNYTAAQDYLKQAETSEPNEPLAYAMTKYTD